MLNVRTDRLCSCVTFGESCCSSTMEYGKRLESYTHTCLLAVLNTNNLLRRTLRLRNLLRFGLACTGLDKHMLIRIWAIIFERYGKTSLVCTLVADLTNSCQSQIYGGLLLICLAPTFWTSDLFPHCHHLNVITSYEKMATMARRTYTRAAYVVSRNFCIMR